MSDTRESLELECRLRFIIRALEQPPEELPTMDLYIDGFWAGVRANRRPRSPEKLRELIDKRRVQSSGLVKGSP